MRFISFAKDWGTFGRIKPNFNAETGVERDQAARPPSDASRAGRLTSTAAAAGRSVFFAAKL
jgi:hypothetical protein